MPSVYDLSLMLLLLSLPWLCCSFNLGPEQPNAVLAENPAAQPVPLSLMK